MDGVEEEARLLSLAAEAAERLAEYNDWAEEHKRLHPEAVKTLQHAEVHRLFLPASLGGLEVSPGTCARVCEALADGDPAAAWFVMVYNTVRLMAGYWPDDLVELLWAENPATLVAASGHTPFQGVRTDTGFVVSGRNSFVSGCHYADFVMSPMLCDDEPHVVLIPQGSFRIVDNWDTLGMRGTGSNDVIVEGVELPSHLVIKQTPGTRLGKHYGGQLYRTPMRVVFATYVPVALNLAQRAIDEFERLAADKVPYASDSKLKMKTQAQMHFGRAVGKYRASRQYFMAAMDDVWREAGQGREFDDKARADLYLAGTHTLQTCAEVVRHIADAAGSSVTMQQSPLERIARDMEMLRHHGFANESRYASVAQVLLEAPLDYPLLLR